MRSIPLVNQNGPGSVSIVIPVFNAEKTIGNLIDTLIQLYYKTYSSFEIVLVNDGSRDSSQSVIEERAQKYPGLVKGILLARNFGEHNAVLCGLTHALGDTVVIMDDDFQNPPSEVGLLVEKLKEGYDVVYSYYSEMKQNLFRRCGSWFANVIARLIIQKPKDLYLSSFKALSFPLVHVIRQYNGPFPYIDGLVLRSTKHIGRQQVRHDSRINGPSNYNMFRLLRLWLNMFTGFSIFPLRLASYLGLIFSSVGLFLALFFTYTYMYGPVFAHKPIPPGWASVIVCITLFGGVQLCVMGLMGEYLGRLFLTSNKIPQYVIKSTKGI